LLSANHLPQRPLPEAHRAAALILTYETVKFRFIDCDDSAAVGVLACLELPKYRLWLPIELSLPLGFSLFP
jgi:hypothetical protein